MENDIFLDISRSGDYIFPQAYSIFHVVDMKSTLMELEGYCKQGLLKRMYEFVCPYCKKTIIVTDDLGNVQAVTKCECGYEYNLIDILHGLNVIYKKV